MHIARGFLAGDDHAVDLVAEGFDAAIGGGFDLSPGVVARELASPAYLQPHGEPRTPAELSEHAGILILSPQTGRVRPWMLRNPAGEQAAIELQLRMTLGDPEAACLAAQQGLDITLVSTAHALPYLRSGALQRVLPNWYVDSGVISIYFAGHPLLPQKTRVFVDFIVEQFRRQGLAEQFSAH